MLSNVTASYIQGHQFSLALRPLRRSESGLELGFAENHFQHAFRLWKNAGWLWVQYLARVSFASVLKFAIWRSHV